MNNKKLSALEKFALNELKRLEDGCDKEDLEYQQEIDKNIIDLISLFASQGHSDFSGAYVVNLFMRLIERKPIGPLTGEEDEWEDVGHFGESERMPEQNKRCPMVFRYQKDNNTAIYLDGKVFSVDKGKTWFTNSNSKISITFPYIVPNQPEYVYLEPLNEEAKEITEENLEELMDALNTLGETKIIKSIEDFELTEEPIDFKKLN